AQGLPALLARGGRLISPTTRAMKATGAAAEEYGAAQRATQQAAATVREQAPKVRGLAEREINATTGAAQRQAATAEAALPRGVRLRSDRLQGPPPAPPESKTSPILAPVGRGLNAEPIVTTPRAKVLRPLRPQD